MRKPPVSSSNYRQAALAGYAIILVCFGGAGAWAALASLDSAVTAHGSVTLQSRRQVIQHLEGGIVKEISVREGQSVQEGEALVRLDDTQPRASLDLVQSQLDALIALQARLVAERDEAPGVTFPPELMERAAQPSVAKVMEDQLAQFRQRRGSLDAQVSILRNRQAALNDEVEGLKRERAAVERQLFFIQDELIGVTKLADQGLVAKNRKNSLEREKARLDGVVGRNDTEAAKAAVSLNEMELQINQLRQKLQEEVASQMQDANQKILDQRERRRVALDTLGRLLISAPREGFVQSLRVSTIGQVLRPGEILMEIVPAIEPLIIEAQVSLTDVDNLHVDMQAEVRFPSFHSRRTPVIIGRIGNVSRDRLIDEMTRQPYFLAQISIQDTDIPEEMKGRLRAGMPVEVVVPTGERTPLQYLMQPLTDAMRQTFTEK